MPVRRDGTPFDPDYARTRRRNEPLAEIFQVKGSSETHPLLSAEEDEFAGCGISDMGQRGHDFDLRGAYARSALRMGLEFEGREPSLRQIGSETEPPNLATEKNTGCGVFQARNPQSPVRIRERLTAKTPRNRGNFPGYP